jgi:hypothetical protein
LGQWISGQHQGQPGVKTSIEVIRLRDPAHAEALHHRYCDFWLVDSELELNAPMFGLARPRTRQRRKPANAG